MHAGRTRPSMSANSAAAPVSPRQKRSNTVVNASPAPRTAASRPSISLSPGATSRSVSQSHTHASPSLLGRGASGLSPGARARERRPVTGSATASVIDTNTLVSAVTNANTTTNTAVSRSTFAQDGEKFEPHTYETTFCLRGKYPHVALAEATATLWCANDDTGALDLYSCVTGQYVTALPPLAEELRARQAELCELPLSETSPNVSNSNHYSIGAPTGKGKQKGSASNSARAKAATPRGRGAASITAAAAAASPATKAASFLSSSSSRVRLPSSAVQPSAMLATASHVWVGYADGTVGVYDALLLRLLTVGQFHTETVFALVALRNGQVVSASGDGLLVLWDTEQEGFEAVTRVTCLIDAVQKGAGELSAMTAAADAANVARVFCGFASGAVYSLFLASRPSEQTPPHLLRAQQGRITDMAVVREVLFTAAEDQSVCAWYIGSAAWSGKHHVVSGTTEGVSSSAEEGVSDTAAQVRAVHASTRLLKRMSVRPCVRALLPEERTRSLWVAYADGLLERWSGNPDDDYGVEEVIADALVTKAAAAAENSAAAATAGSHPPTTALEGGRGTGDRSTSLSGAGGLSQAFSPSVSVSTVKALLSLNAVQTVQWLALSSNGVNKVWYGHQNTLEMNLANSVVALHDVIAQDTEDAAAWRERVSVLTQKELERRPKYICILEQLSEQRVLRRHYETWKQAVLYCGMRRTRKGQLARILETKTTVRFLRCYFAKWVSFYDAQQRHMRRYVLSMALSRSTEQQQLQACFVTWQFFLVRARMRCTAQTSAAALEKMTTLSLLGSYFHAWRAATARLSRRQLGISPEQLALLAGKARRQVQQRVLRQWVAHYEETQRSKSSATSEDNAGAKARGRVGAAAVSALSRYAAHYARLQEQRHSREILQLWREWTVRKAKHASMAVVAALREQQILHEVRQAFFLRWRQLVHARHAKETAAQLSELEQQLRHAEVVHRDIFEKLQLQKQLEQLLQTQTAEEQQLAQTQTQLRTLEHQCAQRRLSELQQPLASDVHGRCNNKDDSAAAVTAGALLGSALFPAQQSTPPRTTPSGASQAEFDGTTGSARGLHATTTNTSSSASQHSFLVRLPNTTTAGADADRHYGSGSSNPNTITQLTSTNTSVTGGGGGGGGFLHDARGHMAANAVFYRALVDQQRLSPIVLTHMPLEEAVHHVMGQLKGNVVNLYTDLALFRQVKDRRRSGTAAVGILLEAFGELKRMIVSTVRGASASAASAAARTGVKATRWPLSMEALDCIPVHQCSNVLSAIKTLVVAYDLLLPEDVPGVQATCEELVTNADWVFLIAQACYLRRKPLPPANNRQLA